MTALIIAIALIVLGYFLLNTWSFDGLGILLLGAGVVGGLLLIIIKLCSPFEYEEHQIERNQLQHQLEVSKDRDILMDTMLTMKIVQINTTIEKQQYYNGTVWGWYVDDRYMTLEPVQ